MFTTFLEAKEWIENLHRFGEKLDLHRMSIACEVLGHPEKAFKSIHIAGTNGKGSTANYIKNILIEAGYKVGIYTSPYVVKFNERIGINYDFISDENVLKYTNILKELWDKIFLETGDSVTFFEVLTLMCFIYFKDEKIEYGVIEVGLGGTLDATNIITPIVSCITNISYDHMKQLGNTLESIALNKLGIVKEGIPLITSVENESLFPLFYEITSKNHSKITFIDFNQIKEVNVSEVTSFEYYNELYKLLLPGFHQVKNACLAIETIRELNLSNDLKITVDHIKAGLIKTTWPGRFEIFHHSIILDGAHNIGGVESLKKTLEAMYPNKYIKCLFCMMKDKEHLKIIAELDNVVDEFHFTEIPYPRRADAEELFFESFHEKKFIHHDFEKAFNELSVLKDNEILLVTGSLYFISEIRKLIVK
ncbi:MAG: bifunctional folylpolyglutamate synthase/dihydrofolate synthase [Firmicutes bacterium]|nr:bifunctional folylpolyglutamate synthase/dihydrofolate synthase [Bacillota bacterium]